MTLPHQTDIAIVGAGPHALTLATHLLKKRHDLQGRFVVLDPSGFWMHHWQRLFSMLEIPHLRSPAAHQPHPDPRALHRFAQSRPDELFAPFDLPGTQLFQDFCQELVQRWQLQDQVHQALVSQIAPIQERQSSHFQIELKDGRSLQARRVVMALGGGNPCLPAWVHKISTPYPPAKLCHSNQIDLRYLRRLQGERILVVGGGLTSGHLATGAATRGAQVVLMSRRSLYERLFDADPGWLDSQFLSDFCHESNWEVRWEMIQLARNGGSMTPMMMADLRRHQHHGRVQLLERCQVVKAEWQNKCWLVRCHDGTQIEFDRIWLATGTKLNVSQIPCLKTVLDTHPIETVHGLPVLEPNLRWQGCDLFLMGGLASLQVGPTARNLSGARAASDRIVSALTKPSQGPRAAWSYS